MTDQNQNPDQDMFQDQENQDIVTLLKHSIENLQPRLEKRRRKFFLALLIGIGVIVTTVTVYGFASSNARDDLTLPVIVFSLIGSVILYVLLDAVYRKTTKNKFLNGLAKESGLNYRKNGVFPLQDLYKHRVLPSYDRHRIEDGFTGLYKGIPIALEEIVLSDLERDPNDRHRHREEMVFWGLAVRIKLRRPLTGHTVVFTQNMVQSFFRTRFSKFQRVKLVSNKFEKQFDVMSTDQVEARVILDPAFMERFMAMGKKLKSKWTEVSFLDNEIVVIVQRYRPMFEIGTVLRPLDDKILQKSARDLEEIVSVVDILKLNPQVGI